MYSRNNRPWISGFPLTVFLLICLLIPGCGGGGGDLTPGLSVTETGESTDIASPAEILAAADDVPGGVDPDVHRMLCEALAEMLAEMPADKAAASLPDGPGTYVRDLKVTPQDMEYACLTWSFANPGDYDQNMRVNSSDITRIGYYYEMYAGDPDWSRAKYADGNHDGAITVADLTAIGANYGHFIPYYSIYRSRNPADYPPNNGGVPGPGAERIVEKQGGGYNGIVRTFYYRFPDWQEQWYYWVVPTDGKTEGRPSNLAGGPGDAWPLITDMTPHYGLPGTEVTLLGSNFGEQTDDSSLEIGGQAMEILSWEDGRIVGVIPEWVQDGMIRACVGDLFADSGEFLVTEPPVIEACSPESLEAGRPLEINGRNFRKRQGTGMLLIDGRIHTVAGWSDDVISIDYLDPLPDTGDTARFEVVTSNGLVSAPLDIPGDFSPGSIEVSPRIGYVSKGDEPGTVFTLAYAINDIFQDYEVRIYPDYPRRSFLISDTDSGTEGLQFGYSPDDPDCTYHQGRSRYNLALEFSNPDTGHVFILEGPQIQVYEPTHSAPKLVSITPVDFGRSDVPAPNDICYDETDGTYLDFTFLDDQILVSSARTAFVDGDGNELPSVSRDPSRFLCGGSDPRPYCYRNYFPGSGNYNPTSLMSLKGEAFGNEPGNWQLIIGGGMLQGYHLVGWDGNSGWTDNEIRFSLSDSFLWKDRGSIFVYCENQELTDTSDNYLRLRFSPVVGCTVPDSGRVDPEDGILSLEGVSFVQDASDGLFGSEVLTIWRVPVTYVSPWTGEEVTRQELLVTPLRPEYVNDNTMHLRMADMDPDHDGLVTVEARSDDGFEAQLLEAELAEGVAEYFIWAGMLADGSLKEIINSGIFSQEYEVELVNLEEDNQAPVAELINTEAINEAPTSICLSATGSTDPDGTIIDYQWDFDNDGVFNEIGPWSEFNENEYRGKTSLNFSAELAGSYTFRLKVTDDRGATDIAILTTEIVDEYDDIWFSCRLFNPDEFSDVADSEFQVYLGDPADGGTLVASYPIEVDFVELGDTLVSDWSMQLIDLPAGQYWFRVANPDVEWRTESEKESLPKLEYEEFAAVTVPCHSKYGFSFTGAVYR